MRNSKRRDHRSHQVNSWVLLTVLALLPLLLLAPTASSASVKQAGTSDIDGATAFSIWLDGPTQAFVGQEIAYKIATDAQDLFGAELDISFDPAVLQVLDGNSGDSGIQITPGSCPAADFVVQNSADNTLGTISYAATSLAPTVPCDGGVIAMFRFQVVQAGTTQVSFDEVILADKDGMQIPATALDLTLEISESKDYHIYLPVILGSS